MGWPAAAGAGDLINSRAAPHCPSRLSLKAMLTAEKLDALAAMRASETSNTSWRFKNRS